MPEIPIVCNQLIDSINLLPLCMMQFIGGGTIEFMGIIILVFTAVFMLKARLNLILGSIVGFLLSAGFYVSWPSALFALITIISMVFMFGIIGYTLKTGAIQE